MLTMKLLVLLLAVAAPLAISATFYPGGHGGNAHGGNGRPQRVMKTVIRTANAPAPLGPYSQGIKISGGSTLYIAGQIGLIPATGEFVDGTIEGQTEQVLKNIGAILAEAGGSYSNLVKCTIMLADIADFAAMNTVYAKYLNVTQPPARAAFAAATLPKAAKVEIDCIGVL